MVVVGSAEHGMMGRVVLGSTASRLLHTSPIPVAIAPRGFRAPPGGRVSRATCSFRADEASRSALEHSARICRETGAALRVATFGVLGATMYPPEVLGEKQILATFAEQTSEGPGGRGRRPSRWRRRGGDGRRDRPRLARGAWPAGLA